MLGDVYSLQCAGHVLCVCVGGLRGVRLLPSREQY